MVRAFFVALTLAFGLNAEPEPAPREPTPTPVPKSVLAVFFHELGPGSELARIDPVTLKPSGDFMPLAAGSAWITALSPNRQRLAASGGLGTASVELVDLRRMRSLGVTDLKMDGDLRFLSWERSLLAVVDDYDRRAVVRIDPKSRTVLARYPVDGTILQVERGAAGQVVLLLGPRNGIGKLRLAVVGGKGMSVASVPTLTGGTSMEGEADDYRAREVIPALVVDPEGRRALVYAQRVVVEISLDDLAPTTHVLSEPASILRRFRNWLEPAAEAKIVEGSYRSGEWIGGGRFAVTGMDFAEEESRGAGLSIVDTKNWTVHKVAAGAAELAVHRDTLLTFGYQTDDGIRGYDLEGRERFHLLRGESAWIQLAGGLAYAQIGEGKRIAVIDPKTGTKLNEAKVDRPLTLVEGPPMTLE
jgi:hypothetical protein